MLSIWGVLYPVAPVSERSPYPISSRCIRITFGFSNPLFFVCCEGVQESVTVRAVPRMPHAMYWSSISGSIEYFFRIVQLFLPVAGGFQRSETGYSLFQFCQFSE